MFDPSKANAKKNEAAAKKKAINQIKDWSLKLVPEALKTGLLIDVNEVVCGDPSCSPVDLIFTLVWQNGGRGVFGYPSTAAEMTEEDLTDFFPDEETLTKWFSGKKARWPPAPTLRFPVAARVECRVGPHPVKGWAPGRVVKQYYSEPSWPPNVMAPYQVQLHDGRLIYAPQDTDQVIRLRTDPKEGDPPTPDIDYPYQYGEAEGDDEDDGEEMEAAGDV